MKITRIAVYMLAAVALVLPLAGCINAPGIESAVICKAVSKTGEPMQVTDNLTPDIGTIYCSVKLTSPSANSKLKAEWYVVKSEEAGLNDYLIGTETVAAAAHYAVFAFARSDKLLPRGDYQVKLYYDDKFVQSAPFYVQGQAAASSTTLSDATTCAGLDQLTGKPLSITAIFPGDASSICCSVKVSGAQFNDQVKARWTYISGELAGFQGKTIAEQSAKVEGREYVSYSFGPKAGQSFPRGDYSVGLYVDDRELVNLPFSVVAPADIKGPYVGETAIFTYKDAEKKDVNATAYFPTDNTSEINFSARIYNAPAGTEMNIQWIIVKSDEAAVDNYLVKEDKNKIEGTLEVAAKLIAGKDKFVRGDYVVKLMLDGQEKAAVPFKVQ
ncbi:MAG: hypothetical protein NTV42_08415 [Chloroflexi bacterium]|nr:hypothetical protein [Chloroflexota bacterium]